VEMVSEVVQVQRAGSLGVASQTAGQATALPETVAGRRELDSAVDAKAAAVRLEGGRATSQSRGVQLAHVERMALLERWARAPAQHAVAARHMPRVSAA
jgi:hypothetical protein